MVEAAYNDKPITGPEGDLYRLDPFAQALAASIRKMAAPEGTVLALNGPWGSGKSSTVNLIKHHLKPAEDSGEIIILNFRPWWFKGDDALALAFFRELYAGMSPSLGEKFKKALPQLGARILQSGSIVEAGLGLAGIPILGRLASSSMKAAADYIGSGGDTVEKLHAQLSRALKDQSKRFVIIIDDIDRLTPEEALMIFRLVKSVGHLPNVIYLLVFDRALAEKIANDRFPSEGPQYLEKIIQASFDLPLAQASDLQRRVQEIITQICGQPAEEEIVRFMNVFYDVVAPEIRSPRDIVRLGNALPVTWAAIGTDVDLSDFVGLETIRVLRPEVYRRLRANRDHLLPESVMTGREKISPEQLDKQLFGDPLPADSQRLRRALMRIFPPLERHWSNVHHGESSRDAWDKDRRVCSAGHIDTYFRFTLGEDAMSANEIDTLVKRAGDEAFIEQVMLSAIQSVRKDGTTKAAMVLDQLNTHADEVKDADVEPLLKSLFRIADRTDVEADKARGFSTGSNPLRLHWLLRRLTKERFDDEGRSRVLKAAAAEAPLGWLVNFSESAYRDHHPRPGKSQAIDRVQLLTVSDMEEVRGWALAKLRAAASSGELLKDRHLPSLLFRWREMGDRPSDEKGAVTAWVNAQLDSDEGVVALARAFTGDSWVQESDDVVAKRRVIAMIDGIEEIMDKSRFRRRVEEVVTSDRVDNDSRKAAGTFLEAWRSRERGSDDE